MFVRAAIYHRTQSHIPINNVQKVCKGESILAMNSLIQPVTSSCLILNFALPIIKSTVLCCAVSASHGIEIQVSGWNTQYHGPFYAIS